MRHIKIALTVTSLATLVACGGGGGAGSTPIAAATTYTGQFIDSPTKGLTYTATPSGLTGTTDENGAFKFQAGDTVSFSISTASGNIDLGSATPMTPTSASATSTLHVMSMDNGTQIAQTLQSLDVNGNSGSHIDVSNVTASVSEVTAIKDYISTGGITSSPAKITVQEADAIFNAMASLGNITKVNPSDEITKLLSGSVVAHTGVMNMAFSSTSTAVMSGQSLAGKSIKAMSQGITYFKPDNSTYSLCVNSPWIDTTFYSPSASIHCNHSAAIAKEGTWTVPANSTDRFDLSHDEDASFVDTVTFKDINTKQGFYTDAAGPFGNQGQSGLTGYGEYIFLSTSFNKSFLAGKTTYSSGNSECSDGIYKFVFSADGSTFSRTCKTAKTNNSANTIVTGTITDGLDIPGIVKMSFSNNERDVYTGITVDSTDKKGRNVIIIPGDSSLCDYSHKSYCGVMKLLTYSN
jgi:hypothetical protein